MGGGGFLKVMGGGVSYAFSVEMRVVVVVVVVASLKWCPISETTGYSGRLGKGFK